MQVLDEGEEPDSMFEPYPPAPEGSTHPPRGFQHKMKWVKEMNPNLEGCQFGMFSKPLFTWKGLPCSLHFEGANPSTQALEAVKAIHDDILGYHFGAKEGTYGAGGGGVHVIYLGGRSEDFPDINGLLDLIELSPPYQPQVMQRMTTADPLHQQLFPKRSESDECGEGGEEQQSVLSLDKYSNLLQTKIATKPILSKVSPQIKQNYPSLASGRIIFLLPRFASIHDGDCLEEPILCPTAVAFQTRQNQEEYWHQFQARPEANIGVFQEVSTQGGKAKEAGEIYESPVFALFQLDATGEILGLVQWDYRD